jgi:hypothetical protein
MHDSPTPPTGPESHVTPATNLPLYRDQGSATGPRPAAPPTGPGRGRLVSRVILPLVLFVVMVGGIAWVTQYVPWRGRPAAPSEKSEPPSYLQFDQTVSKWDAKDSPYLRGSVWLKVAQGEPTAAEKAAFIRVLPPFKEGEKRPEDMDNNELKALAAQGLAMYVKEFETMQGGTYEFPFSNPSDQELEVGVHDLSCTCSSVEICLLDAQQSAARDWKKLTKSETQGIVVPPRARGVTRVLWSPRERQLDKVALTVQLWSQPKGQPRARGKDAVLQTAIRIVPPVQADVPGIRFRPIEAKSSSEGSFWCWTSTRADAKKLRVLAEKDDPCFVFSVEPADEKERLALQDQLWPLSHELIKKAWRVRVTVFEERQGKQMDMGSFSRPLSLFLDDEKEPQGGPILKGLVSSEVQVGTGVGSNENKIDLGLFYMDKGYHNRDPIKLRTEPGVVLKFVEEESYPPFLKVRLSRNPKGSTARRDVWSLHIEIPSRAEGNEFSGPLPENSAIVLIREQPGSPPRRIRILVEGTAAIRVNPG